MRSLSFLNNLQIKVMLLFLLVALVPLAIVGAFSIKTAEQLIINTMSSQLDNVADDKAALLEKWISERKADIKVVAGSEILESLDPTRIAPYLELVGINYRAYKGFTVLSDKGDIVFDNSGAKGPQTGEEWYLKSVSGKLFISEFELDPDLNQSVFSISAPIVGERGAVVGTVRAFVGTNSIIRDVLRISLGGTGECYLVDKNGTFLAHKEPRRILTENIAQSESFKNIFGPSQNRKIYTDYRGIEVLGASRNVAGMEWYLVVEQDRDEAFLSADRLRLYVYAVMAVSFLGSIILAWLFSFYVAAPIRALGNAADTIAKGDFEHAKLDNHRSDEIGELYNSFRDMAEQLAARQQDLEQEVDIKEAELKETDFRLKKTQLAVTRSQQLAALGRLAAGVTHEIRTPLTSIKLFLESARGEIEISPDYEEDFDIAMKQIKRIEATINRFLDFAKPQEPVFATVDIGELIEEAFLVIRPKANHQETKVELSVDPETPYIRGDRKQIGEILLNLMVNALEAIETLGMLSVSAYMDEFVVDGEKVDCVRIDVRDTGPGIEEQNFEKLFDPFYTTKASGAGLGLSIVSSTVRAHGGEVKVSSERGKGTKFSVFIPAIKDENGGKNGKNSDS